MRYFMPIVAFAVLAVLPADATAQISVQAVAARSVEDRAAVGPSETFPADVGRVWCWMRVTGAPEAGTTLRHVWFRGDEEVANIELRIGASSWRSWSNKTIPPEWAGAWRVEIRAADGTVLETVRFTVG